MGTAAPADGSVGSTASGRAAAEVIQPLEAFLRLQQQVELAVATLDQLRSENEQLRKELTSTQELLQLTQEELDRLLGERKQVCERIQAVMSALQQAGLAPVS
jgi:hypothetical protein